MPACLIPRNTNLIDMEGSVYGWGRFDHVLQDLSNILKQTSLTIRPNIKCQQFDLDQNMLCGLDAVSTSCQGDSGGPLTVEMGGKHYLSGIVSFGEIDGCPLQVMKALCYSLHLSPAIFQAPVVYTSVSTMRDWIDEQTFNEDASIICSP